MPARSKPTGPRDGGRRSRGNRPLHADNDRGLHGDGLRPRPRDRGHQHQGQREPRATYHGEFFPFHNSLTDTDWVRLSMQQGQKYMLLLYGYASIVDFRIMNNRDSSGTIVTGFTAVGSDGDRSGDSNRHWVTATFEPSASGDYFIELTARAANYMEITYTDTETSDEDGDITITTTVTQALSDHDFHGAAYGLRIWSDGQAGKGEPFDQDTAKPGVFTSGHVATDNTDVSGAINAANDVDWYSVSLETDHQYLIMLEGGARLTGVREWPPGEPGHLRSPDGRGSPGRVLQQMCLLRLPRQRRRYPFHRSSRPGDREQLPDSLDIRSLASRAEGGSVSDVGGCVSPGNPLSSRLAGP